MFRSSHTIIRECITCACFQHVSVQSHHHQGVHYLWLLSTCFGAVAPSSGSVLLVLATASTINTLPDDGATTPKHVGAALM